MHPYRYFKCALSRGTFDSCADGCVVLVMPGRLASCVRRLIADRPHKRIVLQINPGARSKPDLADKSPRSDICHAFCAAFSFARRMAWSRVLVLEDDFFIDPDAEAHAASVAEFVNAVPFHVYNLGRVAFLGWPVSRDHWRAVWHGSAHAVIYSAEYASAFVGAYRSDPAPVVSAGNDMWWNRPGTLSYVFRRPLAYQVFGVTENSREWKSGFFVDAAVRALGLHESHYPGFLVLDALSKSVFWAACLALLILVSRLVPPDLRPLLFFDLNAAVRL